MDKNIRNASSLIVAALAVATVSAPASAAPAASQSKDVAVRFSPSITMDALGNLSLAGMNADQALTEAYGASPALEKELLAATNIGHCVTNNCKPPTQNEPAQA